MFRIIFGLSVMTLCQCEWKRHFTKKNHSGDCWCGKHKIKSKPSHPQTYTENKKDLLWNYLFMYTTTNRFFFSSSLSVELMILKPRERVEFNGNRNKWRSTVTECILWAQKIVFHFAWDSYFNLIKIELNHFIFMWWSSCGCVIITNIVKKRSLP